MDCNKDEAIKARELAELKMRSSDFFGAKKFVLKAQQLFPELDNLYQLLTVCEVHCAAQNKLNGSDMDWYGILKLARMADEATIKKQYRKLALILHPDKNKFAGAEAAFKLIGEANGVLSDHAKRSLYDMKVGVATRTSAVPLYQVNRNPCVSTQFGAPGSVNWQSMGTNSHKQASSKSNGRETFWTCCPFCYIRYQYYRNVVNAVMRCQKCSKTFTAYDLGAQDISQGYNSNQHPQKDFPSKVPFKASSQSTNWKPSASMKVEAVFSNRTPQSEPVFKTGTKISNPNNTSRNKDIDMEGENKGSLAAAKADAAKHGRSNNSRRVNVKRKKILVVESSESDETSCSYSSEEDANIQDNAGLAVESSESYEISGSDESEEVVNAEKNACEPGFGGGLTRRRSVRKRQHVSYYENLSDDDDFMSPAKVLKRGKTCGTNQEEEANLHSKKEKTNSSGFSSALNGAKDVSWAKVHEDAAEPGDSNDSVSEPPIYNCPDPEFNDFDTDKAENCFSVGQIWAGYDDKGGMPRFYGRISNVSRPKFELSITWLEPDPDEKDEIEWYCEELPVACGKYKIGASVDFVDRGMLSHQIKVGNGGSAASFMVYPWKGETWALFKDWDMRWNSNAENHTCYEYEIVEVLSDFVDGAGVTVVYLDKIDGFVSLFQRRAGAEAFTIPRKELFRFSHRIVSFRMSGRERDVPKGSLELDPAGLPPELVTVVVMKR